MEKQENIVINNASVNNLKNITVSFPLQAFTCVIGVSGCGKSSLVYDTLYAESQRSFLECMSGNMYGQKLMDKPQVDCIENLHPALNVAQNYYNFNPRSTVGTLTDISHYLRSMFALIINFENKMNLGENYFSFNNPSSCCKLCGGLGETDAVSEELLIPDKEKTLAQGAILYYKGKENSQEYRLLQAICDKFEIDIHARFCDLNKFDIDALLYRTSEEHFLLKFKTPKGRYKQREVLSKGAVIELNEKLADKDSASTLMSISKYLIKKVCPACNGSKLNTRVTAYEIVDKNIAEVESMKIKDISKWLDKVETKYASSDIIKQLKQLTFQIRLRAQKIIQLKVGYISLDRSIPSLSGGELQRIRIANQLNCSLQGLIYILDEPCRGLHIRDIGCIVEATHELVRNGNTVVAIEHNKKYISEADKIVELGPVGGPEGGYVIFEDLPKGDYLYNIVFKEKNHFDKYVVLNSVTSHNIKAQNVTFPIGGVTCVTGVSGSGKSTLIQVIAKCFEARKAVQCESIVGLDYIKKVLYVNQQPIGKTPRSTVVSYLGIYDEIREIFATINEAKNRNLTVSDFSMNVKGGRCEYCQGTGFKRIEMTYLPDSFVSCPECQGRRFGEDILEIKYRGYSINDILNLPITEILGVFQNDKVIYDKLLCMEKLGLGYIKLGQMSMNLSGGEAQRIKLAKALGIKKSGKNLYILDEPTSGLNEKDIMKLVDIIRELRTSGETLLIIEHNIEFVSAEADYLIDFGNYAGDEGGIIVAQGTPREVFENKQSSWYNCF